MKCYMLQGGRHAADRRRCILVGALTMHRLVEPALSLLAHAYRCDAVDHLQHHQGEHEGVQRAADARHQLLAEEGGAAVNQALAAGRVDGCAGKDAQQDDAQQAADSMNAHTSSASSHCSLFLSCTA